MTEAEFYNPGEQVPPEKITDPRTLALLKAVGQAAFIRLKDIRRQGDSDILIVEFQVERPQYPAADLQDYERIAIVLAQDDTLPPRVQALRKSFPHTLHQNLVYKNQPKELCIFDQPYLEIRDTLTPSRLLQRISQWLGRATTDELHQPDQLLEPLLLSQDRLIFDLAILGTADKEPVVTVVFPLWESPLILAAEQIGPDDLPSAGPHNFMLVPIVAPPWPARLIYHQPQNFAELTALFEIVQLDLEMQIRTYLQHLIQMPYIGKLQNYQLILLVALPKQRTIGGEVESYEWWAFVLPIPIHNLVKLLNFGEFNGSQFIRLVSSTVQDSLANVRVGVLIPTFTLKRQLAQDLSGESAEDMHVVAVGAGSLGSQIILNLSHQGFGTWTIIDNDVLLPHNFARHGLNCQYVGRNKAVALSQEINLTFHDSTIARPIPEDVSSLIANTAEQVEAFTDARLILDCTASRGVAHLLSTFPHPAPRLSVFLGAKGRFCALLFEGVGRSMQLDDLEMQFAAAIAADSRFQNFYADVGTVPYAGSCRALSTQMPQDAVSVHAAAVARFIKHNVMSSSPQMVIWEWSAETYTLQCHQLPIASVETWHVNDWTIRISEQVTDKMRSLRQIKLPCETGGVLLGRTDITHRTVYIADVLASPQDSDEQPGSYRRGVAGLSEAIDAIGKISGGDLTYIGEWHTHPDGCGSRPSQTDLAAHKQLLHEMGNDGLPAIVVIQAEPVEPGFLIDML